MHFRRLPWFQRILSLNAKHSDSFLHTLNTAFDAALYLLLVLSVQVDAVALYRLWNSYLIDPPLLLLEDVIIPEKITHLTALLFSRPLFPCWSHSSTKAN